MRRTTLLAVLGLAVLAVACSFSIRAFAWWIAFGWIAYLIRVLPKATVRIDGAAMFLVGLVLFTFLTHHLAAWLRREMNGPSTAWRWRSTGLIVGLVLMLFVAGIAMVGVTHQVVWLVTDDEPLVVYRVAGSGRESRNIVKDLGLSVHNYESARKTLPHALPQSFGQSWVTKILPYIAIASEMNPKKRWDDPVNQASARRLVPFLLNPALRTSIVRDQDGYGVSHYAGNVHLFQGPQPIALDEIPDGTSYTVMIGEVSSNFQPWAKPGVNRDPALGVNRSPDGFGGPAAQGGANFSMADGSVRFISSNVDPRIMRALGTPNGNDGIE